MMGKIKAAGGVAALIWSVQQADAELDRIDGVKEA